jgi:hypothetical protein
MNQETVKALFTYNPDTGVFTWNVSVKGSKGKGKQAGTVTHKGYVDVCVSGKKYGLHRLAFLWMTGSIPSNVDHINGVKSDNRWCNLRSATIRENSFNCEKRNAVSGYRNVYFDKRGIKKWFVAVFDKHGKRHHFGYFMTPEEANEVAEKARKELHGEFFK